MRCTHYSCTLAAFHCVQRQTQRHIYKNAQANFPHTPPHLEHCASGTCQQGVRVALALRGQAIPEVPVRRSNYATVGKRLDGLVSRDRKRWRKRGVFLPPAGAAGTDASAAKLPTSSATRNQGGHAGVRR